MTSVPNSFCLLGACTMRDGVLLFFNKVVLPRSRLATVRTKNCWG